MNALFLLLALFSFSPQAHARVNAQFFGFVGMLAINDRVMNQITDDDPQRLHEAMNVDEKESGGHRAKTIKLPGKKFTLLCSDQGGGAVVCTVVVKSGAQGTIDMGRGLIRFVALGQEAADLHKLFHPDASGKFEYFTADKSFRISSDGETFIAEYLRPRS